MDHGSFVFEGPRDEAKAFYKQMTKGETDSEGGEIIERTSKQPANIANLPTEAQADVAAAKEAQAAAEQEARSKAESAAQAAAKAQQEAVDKAAAQVMSEKGA
jgi:hypothetical protein